MSSPPFTRKPLPVVDSCEGCGVCCIGQEALPVGYWLGPLGAQDPRHLPASLRRELVRLRMHFDKVGWPAAGEACVWYDAETRRCRHYTHRPDICIEFKVGSPECQYVREERREHLPRPLHAQESRPNPPRPSHATERSGR